ncbi:hypothetical protein CHUAL_009314 [Chamberlinius hualienensis]
MSIELGVENGSDWMGDLSSNSSTVDTGMSLTEIVLVGCLLSTIIFLSITGNLLVCVAIYTDRSLRKLGNLFLVSLAIADLLVSSLVMVFAVFNDLLGYWMFGPEFCDVWVGFDILCSTASILNLCAISLDRYFHIRDPLIYNRRMNKRIVLASIGLIWLVSALVSFLPISKGLHRTKDFVQTDPPLCAMDLSPTYAVVSSSISFFFPCIVMVALYSRLYMYARMHVRNIRAMTQPLQSHINYSEDEDADRSSSPTSRSQRSSNPNCGVGISHQEQQQPQRHSHHVSDHKAAVTLGFIMGIFLVCWVPFFCVNVTAAFCKTCISDMCFKILTWFGYANSALNPIIYSIFNHDFRRAFRRILTGYGRTACCFCCLKKNNWSSSIPLRRNNGTAVKDLKAKQLTHTNGKPTNNKNGQNNATIEKDSVM